MADPKPKNTRLRPGFGDLNQIEKPNTAITYDPTDTTVMGALRNVLKDQYNNKVFENVGQLKGIVLRVEPGHDDSANSIWSALTGMVTKPLKQLKVRIPEIHSALPEPALYGDVPRGSHQGIIELYPTFSAINEEASRENISVGDIVIVDFADKNNLTQPVYIKKFADGAGSAGTANPSKNGMYDPDQSNDGSSAFGGSNGLRGTGKYGCGGSIAPPNNTPYIRGCEPSSGGYISAASSGGRLSPSSEGSSKLQRAQNVSALIKSETGISVSVGLLFSFIEIESRGRTPTKDTVRFEPHVFLGMYGPAILKKRNAKGSRPDLYGGPDYTGTQKIPYASQQNTRSSKEWLAHPKNRKKGSKGRDFYLDKNKSHTNRLAFDKAYKLDPIQAIKATSWGSYQVMGWALLQAYDNDPKKALAAYDQNSVTTSDMMVVKWFKNTFKKSKKRKAFTQNPPNFDAIVRIYNGPGQVSSYSPKLKKAYEKFASLSTGPTSPPGSGATTVSATTSISCPDVSANPASPSPGQQSGRPASPSSPRRGQQGDRSLLDRYRKGGKCVRPPRPTPTSSGTWTQKGIIRGKEYDFEAQYIGKHILDARVAQIFLRMQADAKRDGVSIKINSAFRLPEEQEYFYCKYLNGTGNKAAKPGFSNHQSGVALDLNTKGIPNDKAIRRRTKVSTGQGDVWEWLNKNGGKYGFRQIKIEHWHWQHEPTKRANKTKIRNGGA